MQVHPLSYFWHPQRTKLNGLAVTGPLHHRRLMLERVSKRREGERERESAKQQPKALRYLCRHPRSQVESMGAAGMHVPPTSLYFLRSFTSTNNPQVSRGAARDWLENQDSDVLALHVYKGDGGVTCRIIGAYRSGPRAQCVGL